MSKESVKPFVLGIAVGAVVLLILVFSTGWVVQSSSAAAEAQKTAKMAVLDRLTTICVAQYMEDPSREERLTGFQEAGSYEKDDYVEDSGWATMPGDEKPNGKVADACAKQIAQLEK